MEKPKPINEENSYCEYLKDGVKGYKPGDMLTEDFLVIFRMVKWIKEASKEDCGLELSNIDAIEIFKSYFAFNIWRGISTYDDDFVHSLSEIISSALECATF